MRTKLAWIAFAASVAIAILAFFHEGLFRQDLWAPEGVSRLAAFTGAYWLTALAILAIRPAWFLPAAAVFVVLCSEWWCWQFFNPLAPLAVLYFLGSCFLLGSFVLRCLDAILATLAGLSIWIFFISIAAHFPINTPPLYAAAFALPYLAWRAWPKIRIWRPRANLGHAVLVYMLMMHWLIALKPEASADGLGIHLAIPAMIAHDARLAFDFQFYAWSLMPMGGDFAFTAAYMLGGEAAARLLNFAMLVLLTAMVYRLCLRWLSPGRASIAAALFASTPLVQLVTGSLFVENVWAALVVGSGIGLWSGEVAAAAILLGAAFSVKLGTSAYLLPAMVLAWLALRRSEHRARKSALAAMLLVAFAAPPYLYAWAKTGNPIFPFANTFFRSRYFDTVAFADVRYRHDHPWSAFYELTFRSGRYLEGQGGAFGFQYFLLLAPLLLLFSRKTPRAPVLFGVAGAVLTFISLPNLRYLYPALPLVSIGFGWLLAEMPALIFAVVAILALNVWFQPASGWSHREFATFTPAQFNEYLRVAAPERKLIDILNHIAPGRTVAFFEGDPIAGLHAKAYADTWHTYRFWRRLIECTEPAQVADLFHQLGIHYVIAPPQPDFLVAQHFLEQWTAPTGYVSNKWEIRTLLDAPVIRPHDKTPVAPGVYDDMDTRVEYVGSWLHDRQFAESFSRSITYSNQPGDVLRFYFNGTSVTYVYTRALNRGMAEVLIDGKLRGRLDLYSPDTEWQQRTVFSALEAGPHALELRVTKRKNARSSDYFVDLDAFIVGQ